MISTEAKSQRSDISFEGYDSPEEMIAAIQSRKDRSYSGYNYLNGDRVYRAEWSGFKSKADLEEKMLVGIGDAEQVAIASDFANKMAGERLRRARMKVSVAGSRAVIPSVLIGRPDCRVRMVRPQVGKKIVRITVDVGINCSITPEQYLRVGKIIASAVAALEADNCKVRLDVASATVFDRDYGNSRPHIMCMRMNVKDIDYPMNISQFMFWCGSSAVNRGISFNWRVTHDRFRSNYVAGMGYSIGVFGNKYDDDIEYLRENYFMDGVYLNMEKLIKACGRMKDEEASEYIQALMLGE